MARTKTNIKLKKPRKELILDAGIRLFARVPFSEITIAAVAREADCGHSLVYHYFSNINAIYDESIKYVSEVFFAFLDKLRHTHVSSQIIFIGGVSHLVETIKEDPMVAYYLSLITFNQEGSPLNETISVIRESWTKDFLDIIRLGQKEGCLITYMSAEEIYESLKTLFQGLISSQMFSKNRDRANFRASLIYMPFLKGVKNV